MASSGGKRQPATISTEVKMDEFGASKVNQTHPTDSFDHLTILLMVAMLPIWLYVVIQ
jgi:hypothetical protein